MTLVFLFSFWLTVTTYAEKLLSEESSGHKKWDLTSAIPLDGDGNSVEAALGKNPDVHYIYVCIKVSLHCIQFLHAFPRPACLNIVLQIMH